ncbi:unnamed protein product (macronuclear) [Paramecium tetraurelia]|uniref:Uncharacterized protein n=1 Tax=Paramecium tetraurelia TaxID=5888 RepID=A0D3X8_PARTE|nr:uncharacterized protein GSPATT00013210001 [Paramecium tetraurelia]CAK77745.1 unnamed protein product [Paramecium tetraurelia]|eukprot:XP_001445142.1 hypothetical protein (macronuclear) [Paramecium tetraurelia strain d4-2]
MLNESLESDREIDPERERQKLMLKRQKSIEESLQLNVKDHIVKLEVLIKQYLKNYLAELKKDLEISKKEMSNLRMDIATVKNNHGKSSDDLCTFIQNDAKRQLNEALKKSQDAKHDAEFLDAQLNVLKSDKEKLQDVTGTLEKRIISCETDVGFKHVYD